jgi:hypothetical protein
MAAVMLKLTSVMLQRSFEPLEGAAVVPHITLPAMAASHEFSECGALVLGPLPCNSGDRDGRAREAKGGQDTGHDGSKSTQASLRDFLRFFGDINLVCFTGDVI